MGKYKPGEPEDFSAERVKRSVHESLERLQLKYLDLVHCHDIESAVDMKQVWRFFAITMPIASRIVLTCVLGVFGCMCLV